MGGELVLADEFVGPPTHHRHTLTPSIVQPRRTQRGLTQQPRDLVDTRGHGQRGGGGKTWVDLEDPRPTPLVQRQLYIERTVGAQLVLYRPARLGHRIVAPGHGVAGDPLLEKDLLGHHGLHAPVTPHHDRHGVLGTGDALLHEQLVRGITALGDHPCHVLCGFDAHDPAAATAAAGFDDETTRGGIDRTHGPFVGRPGPGHPDPGLVERAHEGVLVQTGRDEVRSGQQHDHTVALERGNPRQLLVHEGDHGKRSLFCAQGPHSGKERLTVAGRYQVATVGQVQAGCGGVDVGGHNSKTRSLQVEDGARGGRRARCGHHDGRFPRWLVWHLWTFPKIWMVMNHRD